MSAAECVECSQVITQPICAVCIASEMREWLRESKPELVGRVFALKGYHSDVNCVLCGSPMNLCSYCFTKEVLETLKENPELLAEFITFFNFDLGYGGYYEELEGL